jgi:hypothetical protein
MHTKIMYLVLHGISLDQDSMVVGMVPAVSDWLTVPIISDADAGDAAPTAAALVIPNAPLDAQAILALAQVPHAHTFAPPGFSISYHMRGVQIHKVIPHTLDLSTGSYNQWHTHMELDVEEYDILVHLTADATPAHLGTEWCRVDLILKH